MFRRVTAALCAAGALVVFAAHPRSATNSLNDARADDAPLPADWLSRVNYYRTAAGLLPVSEDPALSQAIASHARYMVMHGVVGHSEDLSERWATPEGDAAARASNLASSMSATEPEVWAVDTWMRAPFHAVAILDPALSRVGFGIFHAPTRDIQTAAGLDVIRGRDAGAAPSAFPILWPAPGATVPLANYWDEYPEALSACRGYHRPAGLPIVVQLGAGERTPHVARSWLLDAGAGNAPLAHCVFDETTYRNSNKTDERLGRSILAARDAVILLPKHPLRAGGAYRVRLDVDGQLIDWRFSVR